MQDCCWPAREMQTSAATSDLTIGRLGLTAVRIDEADVTCHGLRINDRHG